MHGDARNECNPLTMAATEASSRRERPRARTVFIVQAKDTEEGPVIVLE